MAYMTALRNAGLIGAAPAPAALLVFTVSQGVAFFERLGAHGGLFPEFLLDPLLDTVWRTLRPEPHPGD